MMIVVWGRLKRVDDFIVKETSEKEEKRASRCMCFAAIGTDIFPGTLREVTCPCDTGYFWAFVTDGVAIHPKHAEDVAGRERKREEERYEERERERRRYIYMFLLPVEEPPILEYLFTSPINKLIHRFINQSPNHPSKIMNFLILIATALFTTLVSCDVRIPILLLLPLPPPHHTPIISISHKKTADYPSLTPKPKNSQQQECMAVTGGVGHGSGTCYRGTAESGIGQTCREVSETGCLFFFLLYI